MLAIAMTIGGLYVLFKGEVSLTQSMYVRGWRARLIGLVLASYLPLAITLGLLLGIYCAVTNTPFPDHYALPMDLALIGCCCAFAFLLGKIWGKPKAAWDEEARIAAGDFPVPPATQPLPNQFAPQSDNPYQSPLNR